MNSPWDNPRIKRILELFGGKVTKVEKINTQKEIKPDEEKIPR